MRWKMHPVLIASLMCLCVVASMGLTASYTNFLWKSVAWVTHTDQVLLRLEGILSAVKDAEGSQRRYLIAGKSGLLAPYATATKTALDLVNEVRRLTVDNPDQQVRAQTLRERVDIRVAQLDDTISIHKRDGFEATRAVLLSDEGAAATDAIKAKILEMQVEKNRLLIERQSVADGAYQGAIGVGLATGGIALMAIFGLLFFLRQYIAGRDEQLRQSLDYLQVTLASIGDAVIATDRHDNVQYLNSVAAKLTGWTRAEALGKPLAEVFYTLGVDAAMATNPTICLVQEAAITTLASDFVLISKSGVETLVEQRFAPLDHRHADAGGVVVVFRDVTELRHRIAELSQREEQFHTLAESIPQLCWMAQPNGDIFWYNRRWYDYTGTTLEAMLASGWQHLHDPMVLPQVLLSWSQAIALTVPFEMVFPLKDASGVFHPFLTRVVPLKDARGQVTRWFGTNTDISAQREIEEDLRKFKFFSDHSNDGHVLLDETGAIRYANLVACERLGFTAAELCSQKVFDIDLLLTQQRFSDVFSQSKKMRVAPFEGIQRRKDGSTFPIEATATVQEINGEWLMFKASRDITERKVAQQREQDALLDAVRLQESQNATDDMRITLYERDRHQQAVDAHAIVSVTDDGGIITYVNDKFCAVNRYRREELLGNSHRIVKSQLHTNVFYENIWDVIGSGKIWNGEICNHDRDQRPYWVDATIVPFVDDNGKPYQYIMICTDISEQKVVQAALIAARENADRANLAKSDFLSSMSHELRTPMNAILGFAQLMEYDGSLGDEQQDNLKEILKGGRHLLELINEVLDLAKIESGNITLSIEPVIISGLVEECRQLIGILAADRKIALYWDAPSDLAVAGDRVRLKQVFLNLLSNAVKYNRPGGEIRLRALAVANKRVRIFITDTGRGIEAKHMARLFEPFSRAGREQSDIEGTGIGLTITRTLVELMGGTIGVESLVGVGSKFWIELPNVAVAIRGLEAISPLGDDESLLTPVAATPQRVLCIDDNPINLNLVAKILGMRSHIELVTAHTPQLGIALARTCQPDLILLDINMPGMDGYEVLKVFQADERLSNIPVVAITANAMPVDVKLGFAAGFDGYMTKPINVGQFLAAVESYLNKSKGRLHGSPDD